ncbi:heme-binding protein [Paraliomyxa miuraensis]|uniref:heme-binding protein n=1 Tax=Paraliomyxa miuraensis TaxID=376150 RepID=UPI00225ABDBC|nr:heme-binding protein [Paraliomyxa miuraensis]MCX4240471.1 heme-binding protein [Paraliomyxa miuraensis]
MGTWTNLALPNAKGGEGSTSNPLSYNVMPLPQAPPNYILKNFKLYETVQFNTNSDVALPATAPNRGSDTLQVPTALFYQQQVYFAEGPGTGQIVHVENGAWLNLLTGKKLVGPYPPPPGSAIKLDDPNQQPPGITIAKQMSIPHGNSILALGSFTPPTAVADPSKLIPDSSSVLPTPTGLDTTPYTTKLDDPSNYQNPHPDLTANPNKPLQDAVALIRPNYFIRWDVSTGNQGQTMNIPFEQRQANVTSYAASYWLLSTDGGTTYPYLAYTQNITMVFVIGGVHYMFPHVTSNVVTKT